MESCDTTTVIRKSHAMDVLLQCRDTCCVMFETPSKNCSMYVFLEEMLSNDRVGHVFLGVEVHVGPSNLRGFGFP